MDKKKPHNPWLLAATGCILVIVIIMLIKDKYKHKHQHKRTQTAVESKARPPDANHADVCYRDPVWARVPPKVHWSTCQADWCRPL